MTRPIVVKLGGSLAYSDRLTAWLAAIAAGRPPVVVVAGGGPFADQVRAAQARIGFDDAAAHRMALLAMAQFAWALAGLSPRLRPAGSLAAIADLRSRGLVPVWDPVPMAGAAEDIPQSWSVTSDSLAVWLAGRLGARAVIFVKRAPDVPRAPSAAALAKAGILDPTVPAYLRSTGVEAWIAGPRDCGRLAVALAEGRPAAERVLAA